MNIKRPKLKQALNDSGFKQKYVASRLGITEVALSYYINGTRNPSRDRLRKIARLCKCKLADVTD